jgi:hypothetical protein
MFAFGKQCSALNAEGLRGTVLSGNKGKIFSVLKLRAMS